MRWVLFTEVQMHQTEKGQIQIIPAPRYINADKVNGVSPGVVPSEVAGPTGEAVAKPAAYIHTGVEHILVKSTLNETLYKLTWEGVVVEGPEDIASNGIVVTATIKRPTDEDESTGKSSVIAEG